MPCYSSVSQTISTSMKTSLVIASRLDNEMEDSILPGLPDDVAKYCLALVPRQHFPTMGGVCKKWRKYIRSKEFITVRKLANLLEEWIYMLIMDAKVEECRWEVLDCRGKKSRDVPPSPTAAVSGFGVAVLNGKLLVIAGHAVVDGLASALDDVYEYDCCLNSWSKLASTNVARYDFACSEVAGRVYVAGGYGSDGNSLSSVEVYDPDTNTWALIASLRRPRWGCFACGIDGQLYVMGGRSAFTIGNSKMINIYDPEMHTWREQKNGCVMVTAHAVLEKKLFCLEWKNQRRLSVFDPGDDTWRIVPIPMTGSSRVGFRLGIVDGKLLLLSVEDEPGYTTLLYDPNASPGKEWLTSDIRPSGHCLCSVTIMA